MTEGVMVDGMRIAQRLSERILAASQFDVPGPYLFVSDVFEPDVYAWLQRGMESLSPLLSEQVHRGDPKLFFGSYRDRLELKNPHADERLDQQARAAWSELREALVSDLVWRALCGRFSTALTERVPPSPANDNPLSSMETSVLVTRHRPGYYLGPHTDRFEKVLTVIFNFPERAGLEHLGTAMYLPLERGMTCTGIVHHDPKLFELVRTVPYAENSALIFVRNDRMFHGVPELNEQNLMGSGRPNLQFNVWNR